jgi:hypothetical protein
MVISFSKEASSILSSVAEGHAICPVYSIGRPARVKLKRGPPEEAILALFSRGFHAGKRPAQRKGGTPSPRFCKLALFCTVASAFVVTPSGGSRDAARRGGFQTRPSWKSEARASQIGFVLYRGMARTFSHKCLFYRQLHSIRPPANWLCFARFFLVERPSPGSFLSLRAAQRRSNLSRRARLAYWNAGTRGFAGRMLNPRVTSPAMVDPPGL